MKIIKIASVLAFLCVLNGCSVIFTSMPEPVSLEERLKEFPNSLPVEDELNIYWNEHMVPFIEAKTDSDLAFSLGYIHSYLRISQMEMLRRLSQGRLSEMVGPVAIDVDHLIRIMNPGKASKEIFLGMPQETKIWLSEFVRGINHHLMNMKDEPHEFKVLKIPREAWTPEDVITIERFGGIDLNWMLWFSLLKHMGKSYYADLFRELMAISKNSTPSFTGSKYDAARDFSNIITAFSRSGSNSFAIASSKSESGAAILANDPHMGVGIPNIWILAGIKSPSYDAVGLFFTGLPFIAIGRNRDIAWGGTNMRSASSEMYQPSEKQIQNAVEKKVILPVRWWRDKTLSIRESELGPMISDSKFLQEYGTPLAVKWLGHQESDEFSSMLNVMKSKNWEEFRQAFKTYAIPGMNILFANSKGEIGQLMAVKIPIIKSPQGDFVKAGENQKYQWNEFASSLQLPSVLNPASGFLVSCNNMPTKTEFDVGYSYPPNNRIQRISEIISGKGKASLSDLKEIQADTKSIFDLSLRDEISANAEKLQILPTDERQSKIWTDFASWDGAYRSDSRGALVFQVMIYFIAERLYDIKGYDEDLKDFLMKSSYAKELLKNRLININDPNIFKDVFRYALSETDKIVSEYSSWGDIHRMRISHFLANAPLIGKKYVFDEFPAEGSMDTVHKTNHDLSIEKHFTRYGSNARHISDMSDMDRSYFVILGGQDGRLNAECSLDQVELWRKMEYVNMPMRIETVKKNFKHVIRILPTRTTEDEGP
ncbi:MAG TPA: penicillin acylase family protein [Victivallales bacterium]|nr:penicillin acylase family protein [Victivallales bacterium]